MHLKDIYMRVHCRHHEEYWDTSERDQLLSAGAVRIAGEVSAPMDTLRGSHGQVLARTNVTNLKPQYRPLLYLFFIEQKLALHPFT